MRLRGAGLLAVGVVVAAWAVGSTALAVLGLGLCLAVALAARLGLARRAQPVRRATTALVHAGRGRGARPRGAGPRPAAPRLAARVARADRAARRAERGGWSRRPGARSSSTPSRAGAIPSGRDASSRAIRSGCAPSSSRCRRRRRCSSARASWSSTTLFTETGAVERRGPSRAGPASERPRAARRARVRRGRAPSGRPLADAPPGAGELMVRELEDAPRDSVAVVLDVDAATHVGTPGPVEPRRGRARRGRHPACTRAALAARGPRDRDAGACRAPGPDARRGLGERARRPRRGARGAGGAARLARRARGAGGRAARGGGGHAAPGGRSSPRSSHGPPLGRSSALVAIDTPTYVGRPPSPASPALQRLVGAGVPLAVLRHGEQLAESLGALRMRAVG